MGVISVSLPSDGTTADAADYNTPITTIVNAINGNLDNSNIVSGAAIATSKLADDAGITTAKLANASVTASKLSTGAATALVATLQTTASTSYTDLATSGPAVTVTIGANGLALVIISTYLGSSGGNDFSNMSFAISGATTQAAADNYAIALQSYGANAVGRLSGQFLVTGLTPGSTTFTAKYSVGVGGTSTFQDRRIAVVPL